MKPLCALLLCTVALAQVPPAPTNLRPVSLTIDDEIIPVTVLATNGHLEAHYRWPHTNAIWIPEASTNNGATWAQANQLVYTDPPIKGLRVTQQDAGWPSWQVRLRKVAIIPQPNVSASSVSAVGLQPSLPDGNQIK